jgi:propionyl-CoA carboxylase beta chain
MAQSENDRLLAALKEAEERLGDAARPQAVEKQHRLGKLMARERVAALVDPQSLHEIGGLIQPDRNTPETRNADAPADGAVVGSARIDGRPVGVIAFDFTVLGGSNGLAARSKVNRQAEWCVTHGRPLVMLLDGGGHRIQEGLDAAHFAGGTGYFEIQARLSGWAPMCALMLGPGFAGPSNFAGLADFVVMVRSIATMGIAGPQLVKAATGESVSKEDLGGAALQADGQGIADLAVDTEAEAFAAARRFLSYLPSNAGEVPPVVASEDPAERRDPALAELVPANARRAYDVRRVVAAIVDRDSILELKPGYARNMVTALARLDGRPVGVIANQPMVLAGALDSPASEKAAHFVSLCDAYGLPIVSLIDMPGFLVGTAAERTGLARRSARLLYEFGQATVPRFAVVLRKGYGLGYIAMAGGRSFDADWAAAWTTAEICAMSIEGAVDVAFRREVETAPDPAAKRAELIAHYRSQTGALRAAAQFGIDEVIDPMDTRPKLIEALRRAAARRPNPHPPKLHGISPI